MRRIYVDQQYIGIVASSRRPSRRCRSRPAGITSRSTQPGFEVIAFDVDIMPGQVIPYQGDLRRF